jgi:hypothetical protein
VPRLRSQRGPDLVEEATEACGGDEGFEPTRGPIALFDAPMILLQKIIQIAVRPVYHLGSKDVPNGARVGVMPLALFQPLSDESEAKPHDPVQGGSTPSEATPYRFSPGEAGRPLPSASPGIVKPHGSCPRGFTKRDITCYGFLTTNTVSVGSGRNTTDIPKDLHSLRVIM